MVIGEITTKLGDKNRVSLPKKFREEMGNELILTRGYEKSLVLVNKDMWGKLANEIINGSFISRDIRETSRFLVGGATEISADKLGRILIPQNLKNFAELNKEVVFIGLVNWVEIWSEENWEEKLKYLDTHSSEIAQQLTQSLPVPDRK